MRKSIVLLAAAAVLSTAASVGVATARSASAPNVVTHGTESFEADVLIQSTLHFTPERITVPTGSTVIWASRDGTGEPHTISIATEAILPKTVEAVFNCGAPDTFCADLLAEHFPPGQPPVHRLDADGDGGLNVAGDSLLLNPGSTVSGIITAPAGTRSYTCASSTPGCRARSW